MRDYAKKQDWMKPAPAKPKVRSAVSEQKNPRQPFVVAPWMWMVAVLIAAVIAIVILWQVGSDWIKPYRKRPVAQQVHSPEATAETQDKPAAIEAAKPTHVVKTNDTSQTAAAKIVEPKASQEPKFEFYTMLPNAKVDAGVPEEESRASDQQFNLQVASYQEKQAAEALRARLILIGLKPQIDKTGSEERTWYRVDLGPFESMRAADVVRHKLQDNGINGSMIRQVK